MKCEYCGLRSCVGCGSQRNEVCVCYPEHCTKAEEHGKCWCDPAVERFPDSIIYIHNQEN